MRREIEGSGLGIASFQANKENVEKNTATIIEVNEQSVPSLRMEYQNFLASKRVVAQTMGIEVALEDIHPQLFPFQQALVQWALRKGRAALFTDTGTGKTVMQLSWASLIHQHTGGDILILAPLAVTHQTKAEGAKLGIPVHICRHQMEVCPGINIANYEMLHHFDASHFVGIVLDEASVLKNYMGKIKRTLVEVFSHTPYRLACTATPAPNDHMEIGNQSEFLGIMPSSEMLMRWFINDTMQNGHYRLKGNATSDFWRWVASWAMSMHTPSDIGFSDEGFILPPLQITHHYVETDLTIGVEEGQLFRAPKMSATTLHREMRITAVDRAQAVADLINGNTDTWIAWCNTNYEADELIKRIPDAIEVRGSDSIPDKEGKLTAFSEGRARVIISKPSICGFGLNWQHCHKAAFVGLSYSMEDVYQAIRRIYRYGQKSPVEIVIVAATTEAPLVATLERKLQAHMHMNTAMKQAASQFALQDNLRLTEYNPQVLMRLPEWLQSEGRIAS